MHSTLCIIIVIRLVRLQPAIVLLLLQYMVIFELLLSLANSINFYVDGAKFSIVQVTPIFHQHVHSSLAQQHGMLCIALRLVPRM